MRGGVVNYSIRRWLFKLGSRPSRHNICKAPLFAPTDLYYIPIIGLRNIESGVAFLAHLKEFRRNLHTKTWSSITQYYPRSLYLWYFFQLFWWAGYCDKLRELLSFPDRSIISELFIRYIAEIDSIIDHKENGRLLEFPGEIKRTRTVSGLLRELLVTIHNSDLTPGKKRKLCHQIWLFRRNALKACQDASISPNTTLSDILLLKERTTGELFRTGADLLNQMYFDDPTNLASGCAEILGNIYIGLQVVDDMLDLPIDYPQKVSNIFYELLKESPDELEKLLPHLDAKEWEHLDWKWAKENLTMTCQRSIRYVDLYLDRAMTVSINTGTTRHIEITRELCRMVSIWSENAFGRDQSTSK